MHENIFLLALAMPMATILLVFAMRYGAAVMEARAAQRTGASQQDLLNGLAEIKTRLSAIETVLKAVD
ncbi:MAG: hypothetical protein Q8L59_06210 [Phenylobacterium sp.]|uniref:hypothetical protein n=1 Tax=Phenylobacterium sp. TaxID=1871053 RepID=UPI00273464E4|nr:hypothetical protein [Phenylobacterium sp.]MDP1641760.1 hypothetical protein [Phenylobacterium sp.]MDP3118331.1 hypothetical protein [Phenylobacterium sp.]MDP3385073.1 hypothetical protein [Phenylobacterium sp.]MDZ4052890.1 hypothetical protein [Phenylobacterium sp.]